jgi:hypothetical protein
MPTLSFTAPFAKNTQLLYSAQEIRNMYLYGIRFSGNSSNPQPSFSDEDIEFQVKAAQKEIENYLGVKLFRQIYSETLQFDNDDWRYWSYIKTTYMVVCPLKLEGFLNTTKQATFPAEWLSSKRESSDELYHRSIYLVPAGNTGAVTNSVIYAGLLPNLGYLNAGRIPNYWTATYTTGFAVIPNDLIQLVGILATINLLYIAGNNTLGMQGVGSSSISIDGLSQSMSTNNYFLDRIKAYNEDMIRKLNNAVGTYRGFNFGSC